MKELAPNTYTFAEYEPDLARRLFLRAGQSISLNAKTFDLLVVLIENRERVVAKEELMNLVWQAVRGRGKLDRTDLCVAKGPGRVEERTPLYRDRARARLPVCRVSLERRLRWTPDGKAIMYQDSYQGLWRQALVEEKPEPVKGFEEVRVFQFTWSLDGKDLTYTTGTATREIILIENFR